MNRKPSVSTLILGLVIGAILLAAGSFSSLAQRFDGGPFEQAAPAMAVSVEGSADLDQVVAVLNQSATGRDLLNLKETYGVKVQFEEGNGSRFRQNTNSILLDTNHDPVKAALFFAHEMHHARILHQGKKADLKSEARQAYIQLKLQEEAGGMVASFQVKMELERVGLDVAGVTFPMEDLYREAYQVATEQARSLDAGLDQWQLEAIGRTAGEQAMFEAFASGQIKTSNTYEPYPDYYGRDWDKAHPIQARLADIQLFSSLSNHVSNLVKALAFLVASGSNGESNNAYAHFTVAVSGHPVAAGMYGNHQVVTQPATTDSQVVDSWTLGS